MATLGLAVASDLINMALDYYERGPAKLQTIQDKPLLRKLNAGKKTFPQGKTNISVPVQGQFMSDTNGIVGVSQDDQLSFNQASNVQRASVPWRIHHYGFIITFQELMQDGITVSDRGGTSDHSEAATRLTAILENRLADFGESWSRSLQTILWKDGSQDAKVMPGLQSILTEQVSTGVIEGLDKATYAWWRSRVNLNLQASPANQTLTKFFRNEVKQLKRYGGSPKTILCGSRAWDGVMQEATEKGVYTQTGFTKGVDVGADTFYLKGVGEFEYDPTMDDMGLASYFYFLDLNHLKLRPLQGEDERLLKPERPYNYLVLLRSKLMTAAMVADQLNCHGIYKLA